MLSGMMGVWQFSRNSCRYCWDFRGITGISDYTASKHSAAVRRSEHIIQKQCILSNRERPGGNKFFLVGSTTRLGPSRGRAPSRVWSPASAKTTSSIVNVRATRRMANPTLRVIISPLAITNRRSFFSRITGIP